jgi:hypothetical protein
MKNKKQEWSQLNLTKTQINALINMLSRLINERKINISFNRNRIELFKRILRGSHNNSEHLVSLSHLEVNELFGFCCECYYALDCNETDLMERLKPLIDPQQAKKIKEETFKAMIAAENTQEPEYSADELFAMTERYDENR